MDLDTQVHTDIDRGRDADPDEGLLGSLLQRAIGEQIAEQRLIREALTDFDRRLELLERTVADRLTFVEREASDRVDRFERSVSERMLAFETVLKRIVDRLTGAEERIVEAVDHGAQVTRTQLDALRPAIEGAVERVADAAEDREEAIGEAMARAGSRLEATVREALTTELRATMNAELRMAMNAELRAALSAELQAAIEEFRTSLAAAERKIRRDVNRVTFARADQPDDPEAEIDLGAPEAGEGGVSVHAARVASPETGNGEGLPRRGRRRGRPLRAPRDRD